MADRSMPIAWHLRELRRRLILSIAVLVIGVIVCFIERDYLFRLLLRPGGYPRLYFHELTGFVGPTMKIALLGGVILSLPVFVYHVVMFLSPGLSPKERRYLYLLLPGVVLFFLAGVAFSYFVMTPHIVKFLLQFGTDIATPLVSVGSYVNAVVGLLFWMGVAFETPFLMYFLTLLGVATPRFFSSQRRLWIVIAFILGAVITPTVDPVNQTIVSAPLIVLYEIGVLMSKLAARKPKRAATLAPQPGSASR